MTDSVQIDEMSVLRMVVHGLIEHRVTCLLHALESGVWNVFVEPEHVGLLKSLIIRYAVERR